MLTNQYLAERLAREHHRELLRSAEERRFRAGESGGSQGESERSVASNLTEGLRGRKAAELIEGLLARLSRSGHKGSRSRLGLG